MGKPAGFSSVAALAAAITFFSVGARGGTLSVTFSNVPPGVAVDLSAVGPADWVHWGVADPFVPTRNASVPPQISSYKLIIPPLVYVQPFTYSDNANGYSWTNGTGPTAITNTTTGVYAYSTPATEGVGFEFSAPADMLERVLHVYVGVYSGQGELIASLTDGSATPYTNSTLSFNSNGPSRAYSIRYAANSAGQRLKVQWVLLKKQGGAMQVPNVTLQAAALATPGIDIPPLTALVMPTNTAQYAAGTPIALRANATDVDGTVTNVEFRANGMVVGSSAGPEFTAGWIDPQAGLYQVTAVATDDAGTSWESPAAEIFVQGTSGYTAGGFSLLSPLLVDLTAEGSLDWMHWGLTSSNSVDRKAVGNGAILNWSTPGGVTPGRFEENPATWTWTDGTPTTTNLGSKTGISVTGLSNGFDLVVQAMPSPQTLKVYAGLYGAATSLRAYLTDFSGPAYYDTSLNSVYATVDGVYTIQFASSAPGQQLRVQYRNHAVFDQVYGNLRLMSATLAPGDALLPARILSPQVTETNFVFSLYSTTNRLYTVEFTESLPATNWVELGTFVGEGALQTVTNIVSTPGFFRIRGTAP